MFLHSVRELGYSGEAVLESRLSVIHLPLLPSLSEREGLGFVIFLHRFTN